MRGPYPKASSLKLTGSDRRYHRSNPTPAVPASVPAAPDWLGDDAKAAWDEWAPELHRLGLLTELDLPAFGVLCSTWSRWLRASRYVDEHGLTYTASTGLEKQHPMVGIEHEAGKSWLAQAQQFGMTPLSRQRLDVKVAEKGDELEQLLSGG